MDQDVPKSSHSGTVFLWILSCMRDPFVSPFSAHADMEC